MPNRAHPVLQIVGSGYPEIQFPVARHPGAIARATPRRASAPSSLGSIAANGNHWVDAG